MKTFEEVFSEHVLSPEEKYKLIIYLAALRLTNTLKILNVEGEIK